MTTDSRPISRAALALCGIATLSLGGFACAADNAPASPAAADARTAASLMVPVKAVIGDAACDQSTQCRVIGVGAKACGGPSGHLAWSLKNTDQKALFAAVQVQAEAQKEENKVSGMRSNCAIAVDPGAVCTAGRCQLATPASAR